VEGTVREVKRRVRVVASSYRANDRSHKVDRGDHGGMEFGGKKAIRLSLGLHYRQHLATRLLLEHVSCC